MKKQLQVLILVILSFASSSCLKTLQQTPQSLGGTAETTEKDKFTWMEKVEGSRALNWVGKQNKKTLDVLEREANYKVFKKEAEEILLAKDRLIYGSIRGEYIYNFWQDEKNTRGLWRRMKFAEYRKKRRPQNSDWDVILDIDKLAKDEDENWVYKGVFCYPKNDNKCLLKLSRGGTDASVYREFDIATKSFVEDGFNVKQGKNSFAWIDENTIYLGTKLGGDDVTTSGYARKIRLWKRGQKLSEAPIVHETSKDHVGLWAYTASSSNSGDHRFMVASLSFFESEYYYINGNNPQKRLLPIPKSVEVEAIHKNQLIMKLRKDWEHKGQTFRQGSLVSLNLNAFRDSNAVNVKSLYVPNQKSALQSVYVTKNAIYISLLENVKSKLLRAQYRNGSWAKAFMKTRKNGSIRVVSADEESSDLLFTFEGFLTPTQMYWSRDTSLSATRITSLPARFNASGLRVKQRFARSKDGTRIPYYVISKKRLSRYGHNMTLLYGYGGFETSLTPRYSAVMGKLWLERGGIYVIANIRGGGEYGPRWHQAAQGVNRQVAFDDFAAVAKDLMMKNITTSNHLGVRGGSNGGLLTSAMLVQHPRLLNAVVSSVPLTDMLRFHKLLAGASWKGEYGDPEKESDRKALAAYSPYHNLRNNRMYPKPFFLTSTKDDRVHPAHARKMAAKMESFGHQFYYYENVEGGHSASANRLQRARREALVYTYLHKRLKPVDK